MTAELQYFDITTPTHDSIKIRYIVSTPAQNDKPLIVAFAGFGEQRYDALLSLITPLSQKGFNVVAVAIPFHTMSVENTRWLITSGLEVFLKHVIPPQRDFFLLGTSRGAAIAACATKLANNCRGLVMVLPLGLNQLTAKTYIRRAFWDYLLSLSFLDKAARQTSRAVIYEAWHHTKYPGGLKAALRLAIEQSTTVSNSLSSYDITAKKLAIFIGKKDRVFRLDECRATLQKIFGPNSTQNIIAVEGGHTTVGSRLGQRQLKQVAEWLANHA